MRETIGLRAVLAEISDLLRAVIKGHILGVVVSNNTFFGF
jgi:antitoxin (DNA-binding transcriptional repressor) of toxin-antitoxin stability system